MKNGIHKSRLRWMRKEGIPKKMLHIKIEGIQPTKTPN
jgi:hypothetical protein